MRQLTDRVGQLQDQVRQLITNTGQGGQLHTEVQACLRRTVDLRDAARESGEATDTRLTDLERRQNDLEAWRNQW